MNCHTKLKFHLDRYAYKRGAYKGTAPADASKRWKDKFRVVRGNGGQMHVRFHSTDIITAYEDGRIVVDTYGWHTSPTTRDAVTEALNWFAMLPGRAALGGKKFRGLSQTVIHIGGATYRYYDRMEFSATGALLSKAIPFTSKVADREERAEFRKDIKDSGFAGVFPVLYEAATTDMVEYCRSDKDAMCSEHLAHQWPGIVARVKFPDYHHRNHRKAAHDTPKAALRALVAKLTKNMTKFVDTDVTVL